MLNVEAGVAGAKDVAAVCSSLPCVASENAYMISKYPLSATVKIELREATSVALFWCRDIFIVSLATSVPFNRGQK